MNIGIIDAELISKPKHRFPNLASMKISGYHKTLGDNVKLILEFNKLDLEELDRVYVSKVFTDTKVPGWLLKLKNIIYGGTGFFFDKAPNLPDVIEHSMPDYHLYDEWVDMKLREINSKGKPKYKRNDFKFYLDYSIGYTTRGCFRKCGFCVNQNYDKVVGHSPLKEFLDESRSKICLLDDNILGYPDWKSVFEELIKTNKPFQYRQGMDERLLTEDKMNYLKNGKYDGSMCFAFDNIEDKDTIINKAELIRRHFPDKSGNFRFYVLCGYDKLGRYDKKFWIKDLKDTFERVYILSKYHFLPYIMRYKEYENSEYRGVYINIARWCNQPNMFKKLTFRDFCIKSDISSGGQKSATWRYFKQIDNDIFRDYLDVITWK